MSKAADFTCPPVDIAQVEQKAKECRTTVADSDVTDAAFMVIENLSGKELRLQDQRCEAGKWVYGPPSRLREGQAMVLMAGQPKMTLSGVGGSVILSCNEFAVKCCFENTIMRTRKIYGAICEREEKIAQDVFDELMEHEDVEKSKGEATFDSWVMSWTGHPDTKIFTIYKVEQAEKLAKWQDIHAEEEPSSAFTASAGAVLRTVDVKEKRLTQFLEVVLTNTLTELQYTEGAEEISETVHGYMKRDADEAFELVWSFADADGSGALDEGECQRFATEFFSVFIHEAPSITGQLLKKQNADAQKYQVRLVDDAVVKIKEVMTHFSVRKLSKDLFDNMWNVEDEVHKDDFQKAFLPIVNQLLTPIRIALIDSKVKEEAIEQEMEKETGVRKPKKERPWTESLQKRLRCECF